MKPLTLEITNGQLLHSSLVRTLTAAMLAKDLDEAERFLSKKCTAFFWKVTRGGHHVALVRKTAEVAVRVAIIAEAQTADELFAYQSGRSDIRRAEENARASSPFLKDAPDGSSNLREAMLVEAIRAIHLQLGGCRKATITTGLDSAVRAATAIAEGLPLDQPVEA